MPFGRATEEDPIPQRRPPLSPPKTMPFLTTSHYFVELDLPTEGENVHETPLNPLEENPPSKRGKGED